MGGQGENRVSTLQLDPREAEPDEEPGRAHHELFRQKGVQVSRLRVEGHTMCQKDGRAWCDGRKTEQQEAAGIALDSHNHCLSVAGVCPRCAYDAGARAFIPGADLFFVSPYPAWSGTGGW